MVPDDHTAIPRAGGPYGAPERTALVLGGGGVHGAVQVGMLEALREHGFEPDLIVGTSIGALNGAMFAAEPAHAVERLRELWRSIDENSPFDASLLERATTFARTRTHLHANHRLRRLLLASLPARTFEDLELEFHCVAACIERATAQWFTRGPLIEALLASCAVPGLLPPVEIDGEHYVDGGLVDSIPVGRAIDLGATRVYVLQVGRVEQPLAVPSRPWEVGLIAFEIARRHRFMEALDDAPQAVEVHVLPTGVGHQMGPTDSTQFRYRDTSRVSELIEIAYRNAKDYLAEVGHAGGPARREDQEGQNR